MRCFLLVTSCLTVPWAAHADDFPAPAPATEAVIYLQGAEITRTKTINVPAGTHRLLVPVPSGTDPAPKIVVDGATLGAVQVMQDAVTDGRAYLSAPQQQALEVFETAQEAAHLAEDARLRAASGVKAAEDRLTFLRSVSGGSLSGLDPAQIIATAEAVAAGTAAAEILRADARAALRSAERAVAEAGRQAQQAKRDLDTSGADLGPRSLMAIEVTAAAAGPVTLTLTSFSGAAGWSPIYDITLGADDRVTLDRKVSVWQQTGLTLTDIAMTLSTADPNAQTAPHPVTPNLAQTVQPQPRISASAEGFAMDSTATRMAAPVPEAAIMLAAQLDGPVVTYAYPAPVTLPMESGSITLSQDSLTLDARVFNRASPRTDETAFLMAEVTNSTGEPLLPGSATLYRQEVRIGEVYLPLLSAGEETDLAFGPQHHLPLEFVLLENETGGRGLFVTSGTRRQDMVVSLRNLSDEPETVETRFALPYSEQEDLEVTIAATPAPDTRDVDDLRGVAEWHLGLPAKGAAEIRIGVEMEWPEEETLIWRP